MRRSKAAWGTGIFLVCVPGVVAGGIPLWIVASGSGPHWDGRWASSAVGWTCIAFGSMGLLDSFVRFVTDGRGTPAPTAPTESLVVRGLYRWVRNPMYVAVLLVILGQALVFAEPLVLGYGAAVAIAVSSFVRWYEEPNLTRRFGEQYLAYRRAVPGWWPRRPAGPRRVSAT
ncbi:MAG: isoprenylcysteine carboxylmethyltransferase family protein [Actinomycetota bacterium]|nr:isoprenylcysteine carboxylmethyltransferase family protein [Actinomycetota bacterium]